MRRSSLATLTGLEPATSAVTGRRANQLRHRALLFAVLFARERTLVDAMRITQIGQPRPCFAQVRTLFFGCSMPAARDRASRTACSPADPIRTPPRRTHSPPSPPSVGATHPPPALRLLTPARCAAPRSTYAPGLLRSVLLTRPVWSIPDAQVHRRHRYRCRSTRPAAPPPELRNAGSPGHHHRGDRDFPIAYPLRDSNPRCRRERPVS